MDWWILKQLRGFVMADLRAFIDPIDFTRSHDNLDFSPTIPNHEHFSLEIQWAYAAGTTGKALFFKPDFSMNARQISASEVLMNLGLLTCAETMHAVLTQISGESLKMAVPIDNAENVLKQLESEHIPVFLNNLRGALTQYFFYLSKEEMAPFDSLLKTNTSVCSVNEVDLVPPIDISNHHFDVALSFPGEVRPLVEEIVDELAKRLKKNSYFYDNAYISQLARPSLDLFLQEIYRNRAKLVVVFLSADYERKNWCGIEFRAIREIIFEKEEKIMFVRTDTGDVKGVFKTDGYVDAKRFKPAEIAKFIHERVLIATLPELL